MRSLTAILAAVALLGAAPAPAASVAPGPGGGIRSLVGAWTCRNPYGALTRLTFRADGDAVVTEEAPSAPGAVPRPVKRYTPDAASGGWRVTSGPGSQTTFAGTAPDWTGTSWQIDGTSTTPLPGSRPYVQQERITYERIDDATIKRSFADGEAHRVVGGDVCARGDAPPPAGLCAVPDVGAYVFRSARPDPPAFAQQQGVFGLVEVLVSLDAQGRVVGTKVQSSPSAVLNGAALSAARLAAYRPALHDCVPVPSTYLFSVEFSNR